MRVPWKFPAGLLLPLLVLACGGGDTKPPDEEPGSPITVPLQPGNSWTYDVSVTISGEAPETGAQVDSIIGLATVEGRSYSKIASRSDQEEPDTSYVQQSGQVVWIRPGNLPAETGSSLQVWAARKLRESLPWKVADFTSRTGEIAAFEADTTFEAENLTLRLEISSANLGRTSLQVPAGSYTDVYKGRLTQLLVGSQGSVVVQTVTTTLDLYVKDGVGVIKQVTVQQSEQIGENPLTITTTTALRSRHAGP